jgi:glycosyltransferase involved in cell wall biosynthesis
MPDSLIVSALIPKIFGSKVILDIHDPMPNVFMSKFKKGSEDNLVKLLISQESIFSSLADEVITANPIFKEELSSRGIPKEKILVINNIPDPRIFSRNHRADKTPSSAKKFTLIYPGTIASRYCLNVAIHALPKLSKEIPNIRLRIIGNKSLYADELEELASQLNVLEYLDFNSVLPAHQIASEIAKADVGIYTALPDPHMDIAMPGKVLEYVMMGIPVVASRLRILEAFFDDSSMLFFSPGNIDEFVCQVLKLYNNPSLKKDLIGNADAVFTHKYTWSTEFKKYLDMIQGLVK